MNVQSLLADHVAGIGSSGIRRVFELGATLDNPINLSIGEPDFCVPEPIKESMIQAIRNDLNGYTVTRGLPALRERISEELRREFDWNPDVFVTCGVSGGLYLALMACLNPGDEVLIPDPYFVSYKHLVRLVRGIPVFISAYDDFELHPDRFEAAITPRTKLILLASPGNPSGVVYREEDVRAISEIARKHDLLVVCDEIYHSLVYDGPCPCPVSYAPDNILLLRGFSKSHAMTGLRMGYAAGPSELIGEMAKLQQYTYVCAPHPAQVGALTAMDVDMSEQIAAYRAKRDLVCSELVDTFDFVRPSGGFYLFPKVPSGFANATEFVEKAISRNLLIIPGEVFSERDTHFRISYAAADQKIRKGCAVLQELAS